MDRVLSLFDRRCVCRVLGRVERRSNLADAQRFVGLARDQIEDSYGKAIELANLRLEVNPEDAETLVNLAWYYANLGRPVASRDSLESAKPETLTDENQLYMVALVLTMLGDSASAAQYLEKAVSLGFSQAMIDATPELNKGLTQDD